MSTTHLAAPQAADADRVPPNNPDWRRRKDEATPRGVAVQQTFYAARAESAELIDDYLVTKYVALAGL